MPFSQKYVIITNKTFRCFKIILLINYNLKIKTYLLIYDPLVVKTGSIFQCKLYT